jgi:hypothetical protein
LVLIDVLKIKEAAEYYGGVQNLRPLNTVECEGEGPELEKAVKMIN